MPGTSDEAYAIFNHARKQINELKEREELDVPLSPTKISALASFASDIKVMEETLKFWKEPETLDIRLLGGLEGVGVRVLLECCLVQQLSSR